MARFRALLTEVADARPDVEVVDLAAWVRAHDDARLRPDGIRFTEDTADEAAERLSPALADLHEAHTGSTETVVDDCPETGPCEPPR